MFASCGVRWLHLGNADWGRLVSPCSKLHLVCAALRAIVSDSVRTLLTNSCIDQGHHPCFVSIRAALETADEKMGLKFVMCWPSQWNRRLLYEVPNLPPV